MHISQSVILNLPSSSGFFTFAGRMQDNEPLMRALSNLISVNDPELVLFVGEALVGNDAVDQLTKFNQRLLDLATGDKAHAIDGILLTKFDTIDDKVSLPQSTSSASDAVWIHSPAECDYSQPASVVACRSIKNHSLMQYSCHHIHCCISSCF